MNALEGIFNFAIENPFISYANVTVFSSYGSNVLSICTELYVLYALSHSPCVYAHLKFLHRIAIYIFNLPIKLTFLQRALTGPCTLLDRLRAFPSGAVIRCGDWASHEGRAESTCVVQVCDKSASAVLTPVIHRVQVTARV